MNLTARLDAEIVAMDARHVGERLETVEVLSPSYDWRRSGYVEQPVTEFAAGHGDSLPCHLEAQLPRMRRQAFRMPV
jgi:hypothetical protein